MAKVPKNLAESANAPDSVNRSQRPQFYNLAPLVKRRGLNHWETTEGSKFDSPKRCPDALHRIALESFLISGREMGVRPS